MINDNANRLEIKNGKLVVAESHEEIRNFATYGMTDAQVKSAWEALRDFRADFWNTHNSKPMKLHYVEIEYLPFSSYSSEEEIRAERDADFFADLEKDYDTETYTFDREELHKIIEAY